jgi:hypothetical protein
MGFHRNVLLLEDEKGHSLPLSTKIPKRVAHVDGSNPMGSDQNKNPSQTKRVRRPIGVNQQQAAKRKVPNTTNISKQRKPEMGWSSNPNSKTGGSPDGETPSKAKKDKGPAKQNTTPKAKQRRIRIGRNKS